MSAADPAVLAVDDNPHNLVALEASLEGLEVDVVRASSGAVALRLLREREFAAVLLDVEMPTLDGYETARRARELAPHTPILFLTARGEVAEADLDRAYALGAVDFLVKPVRPEVLRAKVAVFAQHFVASTARRELERDRAVLDAKREWEAVRERKARERLELLAALTWPDEEVGADVVRDTLERVARLLQAGAWARWALAADGLVLSQSEGLGSVERAALAPHVAIEDLPKTLDALSGPGCRWAMVQLEVAAGIVGALAVRTSEPLDPDDLQLVRTAVHRAAAVVDRRRLVEELEARAAELAEQHVRRDAHLAALAHELRNPLAPVAYAISLLERLDPHPSAAVMQARRVVTTQVRHLARLVDDLVDLTRMKGGELSLVRERVDVREVVDEALVGARMVVDERSQHLAFDRPDRAVPIDGDRARLVQLLANLLDNASKFTPQGGHVTVSVVPDPVAGRVTLRVTDDGRGIPPEWIPQLFTTFGQLERVERRARGGLGLGLALVRQIAELHGGEVAVRSAGHRRGTEVEVQLPMAGTAEASTTREAVVPDPEVSAEGPLRIVVVEDNPDAREMLVELLELLGHEVIPAGDGVQGAKEILTRHPDLAFVDIGLPLKDGYSVAREVRRGARPTRTRLWALTGFGSAEDRQRAFDAGFDGHLVKPATDEELTAALRSVPRRRPS